jgi:rod shape determining protein RodA
MKVKLNLKKVSFDWFSTIILILLTCIGLLFVFSTTLQNKNLTTIEDINLEDFSSNILITTSEQKSYSTYFTKQLWGSLIGFLIYLLISFSKPRELLRLGYLAFIVTFILLIFTLIKGSVGMGAQRWINLGFIKFQPSELVKIFFPPFFVYYLYEREKLPTIYNSLPLIIIFTINLWLILKQPDLGTAILVGLGGVVLFVHSGLPKKFFLIVSVISVLLAPLCWHLLKPYQKKRIEIFFGGGDKHRERYQIEQAKIAIGSGRIFGKGFLKGTQNRLSFLPEKRTDFIFSIICEEWGFIGALLILLLYLIFFLYQLILISRMSSRYDQLLCLGLITPIISATVLNIAMNSQLAPVVGIPLPLISYGLTNLWITMAAIGWINCIRQNQKNII